MPPGSVTVDRQDRYSGANLFIESKEGYLYSGIINLELLINGTTKKVPIGSAEHPIRWTSDLQNKFQAVVNYDWHPIEHRWLALKEFGDYSWYNCCV